MRGFVFSLLFISFISVSAQDSCACCTETHQQFDFWVGDWHVYDTLGIKLGENTIEKLVVDCVLSEHWRGTSGGTGRSYNFFNRQDSTWNQVWVDGQGSNLVLKGALINGSMVLVSELTPGQKIDFYRNRITWTPEADGSVIQLWEILDKNGKVINQAFNGIYKKK